MKKVGFNNYSDNFPKDFAKMKEKIQNGLGDIDIHHIGSTSVEGLGGKGIIDILIGIDSWKNMDGVVDKLKSIGFIHIHPKEEGRIFLSNVKKSKFGDFHIHIVRKNTKQYQSLILFRDVLRKNSKLRDEYQKIKANLVISTYSDRKKYGKLKSKYINKVLKSEK